MRTLIVVPAFNEERNIHTVVASVRALGHADVLVVDDGSSDRTASVAKTAGARVVRHPTNLGIGAAVQTGFLYAIRHGYEAVVRIDGDGQHNPADVARFLELIESDAADVVVGSRFLARRGFQSTFVRRAGILILSLVSAVVGARVTDPTSGYWALNRRALELLSSTHPDDYPEPESLMLASRAGLRIHEIPVAMLARLSGSSSIGSLHAGFYMLRVIIAMLIRRLRRVNVRTKDI